MAKINGVEIKKLRSFTGHDECAYYQGDVWLNGKKLGSWSQDAWCGPDRFGFDEGLLGKACKDFKDGIPENVERREVYEDPSVFMGAIIDLKFAERDCKSMFKEGYKAVYYMYDGFHISYLGLLEKMSISEVRKNYPKQVSEMESLMFKSGFKEIVLTPGGLDIIVDKDHPAPDFLK